MTYIVRAWDEALHPREAGRFAVKAGATAAEKDASKKGSVSFDGKRGAGYGKKGGDKRVKDMQQALNKLGLTDAAGKPLELDGKLGPKTTAAIKKAQRKLGMEATGVASPEFIAGLIRAASTVKESPVKAAAKTAAKKAAPQRTMKRPAAKKKVPVKTAVDNDRKRRNAQKVGGI